MSQIVNEKNRESMTNIVQNIVMSDNSLEHLATALSMIFFPLSYLVYLRWTTADLFAYPNLWIPLVVGYLVLLVVHFEMSHHKVHLFHLAAFLSLRLFLLLLLSA
jgi:hypothetical protein